MNKKVTSNRESTRSRLTVNEIYCHLSNIPGPQPLMGTATFKQVFLL